MLRGSCVCYGYGYGYILGPSSVPPIYLAGSFGLVRPVDIMHAQTRSVSRAGQPSTATCGWAHSPRGAREASPPSAPPPRASGPYRRLPPCVLVWFGLVMFTDGPKSGPTKRPRYMLSPSAASMSVCRAGAACLGCLRSSDAMPPTCRRRPSRACCRRRPVPP